MGDLLYFSHLKISYKSTLILMRYSMCFQLLTEYLALNDKTLYLYTHLSWSALACSFYNTKTTWKGNWVRRIPHCPFQN